MTNKLYYTNDQLNSDLIELTRQMALDNFRPSAVIGPGRGGYIPGVMLSHFYNVPFAGFTWQTRDGCVQDRKKLVEILTSCDGNILLVDDVNDTGETLISIMLHVQEEAAKLNVPFPLRIATLFNKEHSKFRRVDYYAKTLTVDYDPWIVFPYENWWNKQ